MGRRGMEKGHDLGRKLMPQIMPFLAENMGDYYDKNQKRNRNIHN